MDKQNAKIVELDVREQLRNKLEPFQLIMDTVKTLGQDDIFVLHATFKPTPLLGLLKVRGYVSKSVQQDKDHWITTFVNKKNKQWLEEAEDDTDAKSAPSSRERSRSASDSDGPKVIQLDNRGLEPPQPMVRTLAALDRSRPGDVVKIHNDRVPVFLIEELNTMGYSFSVEDQPDGSAIVTITKA